MKKIIAAILPALLVGCAASGTIAPPTDPLERLAYDIDAVLADSIFIPSRASLKIVSVETGETLYDRESRVLMRPASNMKLLTSSAALQVLGKDFLFKTSICIESSFFEGTLHGDIYIKGFGNPDLKTTDLDSLAQNVKLLGISLITGDVVGDASYFDDEYWGAGWMWDDEPYSDEMFISPLSVNDNCVTVRVTPGITTGDSVLVSIDPSTNYTQLLNFVRTVADTALNPLTITRLFKERSNIIVADGEVVAGSAPLEEKISVWKPELYVTQLFKEALERAGIVVQGRSRIGVLSDTSAEIAFHAHRLDSVIINLNKASDNLAAENTLKTMAAMKQGVPGTAKNGISLVHEFLSSLGIDTTKYLMVDGSGVSHYNLLTVGTVVQLLVGMCQRYDLFPLFYESLPVAGVDGTLRSRMKATAAEGNLRAKTGSISGIRSLSGYVRTRDDEMLAFSMMMQNFITGNLLYRDAEDRIGVLLARFSRTPTTLTTSN